MAVKSKKKIEKKLKKELLKRKKVALQAEIARRKLLQALVSKKERSSSVLRRIEDKIPNVMVKRRNEEIKPTFLGKGGLI